MSRAILLFLSLAVLGWAGAWLAERPGTVSLVWQGWRVDTSVSVLLLLLILFLIALWLLARLFGLLRAGPVAWRRSRREHRRQRGYDALTRGMVAIAAGDAGGAEREARRAHDGLDDAPLATLLSAQAAQLDGRIDAARAAFEALAERPDTAFLGERGLLAIARREDNLEAALRHARRLRELKPESPWVLGELFQLAASAGDWQTAGRALEESARRKQLSAAEIDRRRAIVRLVEAQAAETDGEERRARDLARQAHAALPGFAPATLLAARLTAAAGDRKRARRLVEDGWRRQPHPDLARLFLGLHDDLAPEKRLDAVRKLALLNPDHAESHIAVAEAALAARDWTVASEAVDRATAAAPSSRSYRLLAAYRERSDGDLNGARAALAMAAGAPAVEAWCCRGCGFRGMGWDPHCQGWGTFDGYDWRRPAGVARLPSPDDAATLASGGGRAIVPHEGAAVADGSD